jgi:hypothetical protein
MRLMILIDVNHIKGRQAFINSIGYRLFLWGNTITLATDQINHPCSDSFERVLDWE